jgi:hypothetical protein
VQGNTRRPRLFEALQRDSSATSVVEHVLQYLYAGQDPSAEMAQRTILLTPVTLRAEAWLQALADKGTWGGARPGTGPKRRRDRAKLSTTVDPNLVIHSEKKTGTVFLAEQAAHRVRQGDQDE